MARAQEPFLVYRDTFTPWNGSAFALDRPLANPFEYEGWVDEDAGHIGGFPGWIGDAAYPDCPDCAQPMTFIGQLEVSSGGRFYAFVCLACRTTATLYQQT